MTAARARVKFCGMTRVEDALAAARLGVDAIGIVLSRRSRRFAGIERAREIFRSLPPFALLQSPYVNPIIFSAAWPSSPYGFASVSPIFRRNRSMR